MTINISGKLNLSHRNNDYTMFSNGRLTNLSELLNVMLLENIKFSIKDTYNKVLVDVKGKLIKEKKGKCFYLYHVDGVDIDSILWNLVGSKVEIELKNINKR